MQFRDSVHSKSAWGVYFSKIFRPTLSPLQEVNSIISDTLSKKENIAVLCSGGIDSEIIAKLFAQHSKITALVFEFEFQNKIINQHDLEYVDCLIDPNIDIVVKKIDLESIWESSWFWDYIKRYRCTSPQLPIHSYMCEAASKMGYYPVLTEMQPELKMFENGSFHFEEKEKDYAVVKYLRDNNIDCLESPLQCNPEILYSILTSNDMISYIKNPQGFRDSSNFKREQYQNWFNIELKERPKFHGFEGSEDIDNHYRKQIYDRFTYDDIRLFIPYNTLISSLESNDRTFYTTDPDVHVWFRRGFNPL